MNRDNERTIIDDGIFYSAKFDRKGRPKSKQRSSGQDLSHTPRYDKEKVSGSSFLKSTFSMCGRSNYGKSISIINGCYVCVRMKIKLDIAWYLRPME